MQNWNPNDLLSARVFFLTDGSSLADAAEKISRLPADQFRTASSFAFVSRTQIVFDATLTVPLLQYAARKPAVLLVADKDFSIKADLITETGLSQLENEAVIPLVRNADLLQMLQEDAGACVIEASGNYHFVTPSLTHTTRFIRIGDLLHDLETLDRMAFWLRPFLGKAAGILADNWSIASLVLRALQLERLDLPFDCLPEHPTHNSTRCRTVVEGLLARMPKNGRLVSFVSISGSGRLVQHLKASLDGRIRGGLEFECWSLFGYENENGLKVSGCFAVLPHRETYSNENCKFCNEGRIAIPIDPAAYHLKSLHEPVVLLTKSHSAPAKPFIQRYQNVNGLFLIHHNDQNDGRHHAFDLDIVKLINDPEFAKRLAVELERLKGHVDLVVAPNHVPGRILAHTVANRFRCRLIVHDTLERAAMLKTDVELLEKAKMLLIVDDVVNSGSRLKRYIQSVREGHYGEFTTFNYLVAVARPSSPQNLSSLSKAIVAGHTWKGAFYSVEQLTLPALNNDDCPWCLEFDFLSKLSREYSRPPNWISRRLGKLRDRNAGITDEPLLLFPGVESTVLGEESPLCPAGVSSMVATFLIGSALQSHRSDDDPQKQLHPRFPVGNVLSPENVRDRYTEGLIRAILLRLVRRPEWGQASGIESRDILLKATAQSNQKILSGELFLALGRGALPPISPGTFRETFAEFLGGDIDLIESAFFRR